MAQAQTSTGKRLALVIGNDDYRHVITLKNARNDAALIRKTEVYLK